MPTWGEILREVQKSARDRAPQNLGPDLDSIRQKYLLGLKQLDGRAVITYASGWLNKPGQPNPAFSVDGSDVHGFMEACSSIGEKELDLVLHSPGGSAEAAEQIVEYLRARFSYIRALIPLQAKSAATMIALGCDEIVLGEHSELGPIDPQILVAVPEGSRFAPAHAILRDFKRAERETQANIGTLAAWTPVLRSYAGGLIEFCTQQIELSMELVAGWLSRFMLRHDDVDLGGKDIASRAREIAEYFGSESSYDRFRSHARALRFPELQTLGLRVRRLEENQDLQDALLSVYHATDLTLNGPAMKLIENHNGQRKVIIQQQVVLGVQAPAAPPPVTPGLPAPQPPSRADRRREQKKRWK